MMMATSVDRRRLLSTLDREGCVVLPHVASSATVDALLPATQGAATRARSASLRNLLTVLPESRVVLADDGVRAVLDGVLGVGWFVVRSILFDKTPDANWKVAWHQDLSIAVRERAEVAGFGPWSTKDGVVHVEPPAALLARMVTLRLHLDDCSAANGALRIIPGSHQRRLTDTEIEHARRATPERLCETPRGGAVLMRPLVLHASAPALVPSHRRVVHLECASEPLPHPLAWAQTIPRDLSTRVPGVVV